MGKYKKQVAGFTKGETLFKEVEVKNTDGSVEKKMEPQNSINPNRKQRRMNLSTRYLNKQRDSVKKSLSMQVHGNKKDISIPST